MTNKYTAEEAADILNDYPAHPDTNMVRYMPEEPALIVPLVQQKWIDAAIIPASDELKAQLELPKNRIHPNDLSKTSRTIETYANERPDEINIFQQKRINRCLEFLHAADYENDDIEAFIFAHHPNGNISFAPKLHVDQDISAYTASFGLH